MALPRVADFSLTQGVSSASRNPKRNIEEYEADGLGINNDMPFPKKTSLPFRTSPKQARRPGLGYQSASFTTFQTQTPTPVESSEDEMYDVDDVEMSTADSVGRNDAFNSSGNGKSSFNGEAAEPEGMASGGLPTVSKDVEMSTCSGAVTKIAMHRRNARGLSLSQNPFNVVRAHEQAISERVPTPISSSFQRHSTLRLPLIRTDLSPPVGGNTPDTAVHPRLLSPSSDDYDMDTAMRPTTTTAGQVINRSSNVNTEYRVSAHGVPVSPTDNFSSVWQRRATHGLDDQHSAVQRNASPRLHMGYRPDCEKCRLQIPGHYNHVLWS